MAIHLDIWAQLHDREVKQTADKLADDLARRFDKAGNDIGNTLGEGVAKGIENASPKVQKAFTSLAQASNASMAAQAKYNEQLQVYNRRAEEVQSASDKITAAKNREENATASLAEAEYNLTQFQKTHTAESEKMAIMEERVETARRNLENATLSITSAELAHTKALQASNFESEKTRQAVDGIVIARRKEADAHRSASTALRDYANEYREMDTVLENVTSSLQTIGTTAFKTGRGIGAVAAPAVIAFLYETAQVAVTASQSLLLLPAAATAVAAGMGTMALATQGFGQALKDMGDPKKFAADLQNLAPNAQQAALAIQSIMPQLDALQKATQNDFFAGFDGKIKELETTFLPGVQGLTTSIAQSFNAGLTGIADNLMAPQNASAIQGIMDDIAKAFQLAAPAAQQFSQALVDITSVGADFLPDMGQGLTTVATEFANFIREAKQSGKLKEWIQEGIDAVKMLGGAIMDIGKFIYAVFGGASQGQMQAWRSQLENTLNIIAPILETINIATRTFNQNIIDSRVSLNDLINPLSVIKDIVDSIRWFFDPNYKASQSAMSQATAKLNAERAKHGLPAVDNNGNTTNVSGSTPQGTLGWKDGTGPIPLPRGAVPAGIGRSFGIGANDGTPGTWGNSGYNPFADPNASANAAKGQGFTAPENQWSLGSVPIGSFPGVGAPPGGVPNIQIAPGALNGMPGAMGPQGPIDPQDAWDAQSRLQSSQFKVEEDRRAYLEAAKDNTKSETDLLKLKNNVAESERDYISAEMKAAEVAQGKFKDLSSGMDQLGAALDKDFGLSKGLPGLAENITMFLGNLLAAPALMKLQGTVNAAAAQGQPTGGFGLIGMLGAQNMMEGKSPLFGQPLAGAGPGSQPGFSGYSQGGVPTAAAGSGYSGGPYSGTPTTASSTQSVWGGGANGAYAGDAALLAQVPKGIGGYDNNVKDLSKGLVDCASGVEDLVNIMDGKSTVGGSLWTGNASTVLPQMGFLPGMGGPGDFRVGYNSHHMQATLPQGTNVNFGSDAAVRSGGVAPNEGAYDPAFDQHYYRPAGAGGSPSTAPGGGVNTTPPAAKPSDGPNWFPSGSAGGGTPPAAASSAPYDQTAGLRAQRAALAKYGTAADVAAFDQQHPGLGGGPAGIAGSDFTDRGRSSTYDPNRPTGGSNFNPNMMIDTSTSSSSGPMAVNGGRGPRAGEGVDGGLGMGPNGTPLGIVGNGGKGALGGISGQRMMDNGTGLTKAPGEVGYGIPDSGPLGPLNVPPGSYGPPGMPGQGGLPGSVGPFPTPSSMGPTPLGGGVGAGAGAGGPGALGDVPQKTYGAAVAPPASGANAGVGMTSGGLLDTALSGAAAGLDLIAPGAGQAAQVGIKLANRAIQQAGKYAGIGIGGLMETFLPTGGSELANNGWLPRIAGGLAGATPALPNVAGGKPGAPGANGAPPPLTPQQAKGGPSAGNAAGSSVTNNIDYKSYNQTEDQNGNHLAHQLGQSAAMPGIR